MKNWIYLFLVSWIVTSCTEPTGFTFRNGEELKIVFNTDEAEVVHTALEIFSRDYQAVFNGMVSVDAQNGDVYIGTLGQNSLAETLAEKNEIEILRQQKEGFLIAVDQGKLIVLGSDKRGTAYGILELSRMAGVSPWEWWADAGVSEKNALTLKEGFRLSEHPSVAHRGIFINDEDWGLMPWSSKTYEPTDVKGQIGPETHARIFELLLRLRANTFWPAMHDCSVAFYLTPGNKKIADKYGIIIGTSHCEPMVRNTNAEWRIAGTGDYDFLNNRENVITFWEERVSELVGSDNLYTLGIRGVHDSKMLGAKTLQEQKIVLDEVLKVQRNLIARYVNPKLEEVSQVFIPYKEVLDIYNMGLEVPEDVTLLWCDDNYGYMRHFPNDTERVRKGGNGVYYHISYWGRPHDYLWLTTHHPAQLYTQMKLAYDKGAKDIWILNVGDIKPAEYLTELFMDMAWNIHSIDNNIQGLDQHLSDWLNREFGDKNTDELLDVMNEFYRLAYIRKPEYMANTRTEEKDPAYSIVSDLPWSKEAIEERLNDYKKIEETVIRLSANIPAQKRDVWFQLIEYPVRAASEMNKKHLYGQLARHGLEDWALSDQAYHAIAQLTEQYNSLQNGKWRYIMDFRPRRLPVFDSVPHIQTTAPLPMKKEKSLFLFNGTEYANYQGDQPLSHGLGYQRKAITLPVNTTVEYAFETSDTDSLWIEVALAPTHPVSGTDLRYNISLNDAPIQTIDFRTEGRSEEWKQNVLRNQAIRLTGHQPEKAGKQLLKITTPDEGVIIDQIKIRNTPVYGSK